MELLNVPVEVIEGHVLPYLEWNDLLRLRRDCKWTQAIVQDFIELHPEMTPELEINEEDKTFGEFLKMGIPTTRIFLQNVSGLKFYEKAGKDGAEFLEFYGPLITHLRTFELSAIFYGKEWDFLDALVNVTSFEAGFFGYGKEFEGKETAEVNKIIAKKQRHAEREPRYDSSKNSVPKFFRQLKKLKIGNNEDVLIHNVLQYLDAYLQIGEVLESLSLPFNPNIHPPFFFLPELHEHPLGFAFAVISMFIHQKTENESPEILHLKEFDYQNFYDYENGEEKIDLEKNASPFFLDLCKRCLDHDIKLFNVGSAWFQGRNVIRQLSSPNLGKPVYSMVNLHPSVLTLNMPNLERIEIRATAESSPGVVDLSSSRSDWASLRILDITVNSCVGQVTEYCSELETFLATRQPTSALFQFFFQDITRTAVTELRLNFVEGEGGYVPKMEIIVAACPNLKKLTLVRWPGTNKALAKAWKALPGLEEVSLEHCCNLGNVAFVGEDVRSPVFLKLSKLSKLSLKGLDEMPKITDTVLTLVVQHLQLTHLTLTSNDPVNSITPTGVRSLLNGRFAKSIQKFPFHEWSLGKASSDEFNEIGKLFRSSCM